MSRLAEYNALEKAFNWEEYDIIASGDLGDFNTTHYEKGNKSFMIGYCEEGDLIGTQHFDGEEEVFTDSSRDIDSVDKFIQLGLKFIGAEKKSEK